MWRGTVKSIGGLFLALIGLWVIFTVAMRAKFRPVQDVVRRMNRAMLNPRTMETAGQPGADASVIRHRGRTTGTPYETPVGALATDDGFVKSRCRTGRPRIGSRMCWRQGPPSSSMMGAPIGWTIRSSFPVPSLRPMFRPRTN